MKAFVLFLVFVGFVVPGYAESVKRGPSLKKQLTERKLSSVVFEKVDFEEASFDEAMTLFEQLYDKKVEGMIKLQWVYRGFERKTLKRTVTLTGRNISAGRMLHEITTQCGLSPKLDEHAIVLSMKKSAPVVKKVPVKVEKKEEEAEERKSRLGTGGGLETGGLRDRR